MEQQQFNTTFTDFGVGYINQKGVAVPSSTPKGETDIVKVAEDILNRECAVKFTQEGQTPLCKK